MTGELHHALDAGLMQRANVRAELADVVAGSGTGRRSADETLIFDSTGTALEDVAAAAIVFERAVTAGAGIAVELGKSQGNSLPERKRIELSVLATASTIIRTRPAAVSRWPEFRGV